MVTYWCRLCAGTTVRSWHQISVACQMWCDFIETCAQIIQLVIGQRSACNLRQSTQYLPILACHTWWRDTWLRLLWTSLCVDIRGLFLGICSSGEHCIGNGGTIVTMRANVHHKTVLGQLIACQFASIGIQQEHHLGLCLLQTLHSWLVAHIEGAHLGGAVMQHVEGIPVLQRQ